MLDGSVPTHRDALGTPRDRAGAREREHDPARPEPWHPRGPAPEDLERPSSARVYDYLLGGTVNGRVDREFGIELTRHEPVVADIARESRSFLRRAVGFLAADGFDQFLDLGSGIPSRGNVHEVASRARPGARVAYVDVDPVAVGHGETLLASAPEASITLADLRDVDAVLTAPGVADVLDLSRPVALCLFSVLQHVADADDPAAIVARYLAALAPGSALALSHVTADDPRIDIATVRRLTTAYARGPMRPRSREEVAELVAPVDLVDPGLVWAGLWRPEAPRAGITCGHRAAVGYTRAD